MRTLEVTFTIPNGNRVEQFDSGALTQRSFNAASAQILLTPPSGPATTQTFDPVGNLLTASTGSALTTNTWSGENAMLSTVSATESEQYLYGQDGLRRQKTNASGTTNFVLDGLNVLLETTPSGVLQARNTQEPGGVGGLVSQNRSSSSSFFGFDSQQSARILVSTGGLVTDSYAFKAFGEELETGSGTANPFWYVGNQGYYRDFANWMNVGRRRLDATNGRWPNRDLIGFAGGQANLYGYVGNEPVGQVDASGLTEENGCAKCQVNAFRTGWAAAALGPGIYTVAGPDDYFALQSRVRRFYGEVVCSGCPGCVNPPNDPNYKFYQWRKTVITEAYPDGSAMPDSVYDWEADKPGWVYDTGKYPADSPNPTLVSTNGQCPCVSTWKWRYFACDAAGYRNPNATFDLTDPSCKKWVIAPDAKPWFHIGSRGAGIGLVAGFTPDRWFMRNEQNSLCTKFGPSLSEARKTSGSLWSTTTGFTNQMGGTAPKPDYSDSGNAVNTCPSIPDGS